LAEKDKKNPLLFQFIIPRQAEKGLDRERKIAALNRISGILSNSTMTLEEARAERLNRQ